MIIFSIAINSVEIINGSATYITLFTICLLMAGFSQVYISAYFFLHHHNFIENLKGLFFVLISLVSDTSKVTTINEIHLSDGLYFIIELIITIIFVYAYNKYYFIKNTLIKIDK